MAVTSPEPQSWLFRSVAWSLHHSPIHIPWGQGDGSELGQALDPELHELSSVFETHMGEENQFLQYPLTSVHKPCDTYTLP